MCSQIEVYQCQLRCHCCPGFHRCPRRSLCQCYCCHSGCPPGLAHCLSPSHYWSQHVSESGAGYRRSARNTLVCSQNHECWLQRCCRSLGWCQSPAGLRCQSRSRVQSVRLPSPHQVLHRLCHTLNLWCSLRLGRMRTRGVRGPAGGCDCGHQGQKLRLRSRGADCCRQRMPQQGGPGGSDCRCRPRLSLAGMTGHWAGLSCLHSLSSERRSHSWCHLC